MTWDRHKDGSGFDERYLAMVDEWSTLGFLVGEDDALIEVDGPAPLAGSGRSDDPVRSCHRRSGAGRQRARLLAARAGLRVLVAERSHFDGPKPGETAPPELRPLLARVGLSHVLDESTHTEAPAVVSVWGN